MKLHHLLAAALIAFLPTVALGQAVPLQGGPWAAGHVPMYANSGGSQPVIQDSGTAGGGGTGVGLSELGLTVRGTGTGPYANAGTGPNGENVCDYDAPTTNAAGYHYLCMSPNAQGGGLVSYGSAGSAAVLPLSFKVNGTLYQFPFSIGGVVGPATSVVNDAACWNNTTGTLLKDCGGFVTLGGNNTWTGTNNYTGPFQINGTAQTFPASGSLVGTSDAQSLTNKSIIASEINSGTLSATVMPAYTGDVTSSAGATVNTITAGAVTNAKLAAMTQNALKGAATSTAVADLAVPSCSSANNALQWTTNTGFSCATVTASTAGFGINLSGGVFSISQTQPPYGFTFPVNMGLTASAAGSNLTINVTGANGSAPSSTNPVLVPFRSTTAATGTPVWTSITSAQSIVIPSGATLGSSSSNVPFRIWIFEEYNGGSPEIAVAICTVAPTIFPCTAWENTGKTTTTITGLASSAGVLYATTGVSNDAVRIIGYADYGSGLTTAGLYASVPPRLQLMGPGISRPGEVVQTVRTDTGTSATGTTTIPQDNTIPQITEGDQYMTQAITPTATPNLLSVSVQAFVGNSANVLEVGSLFQDATANALKTSFTNPEGTNGVSGLDLTYMAGALTTSSTTFRFRAGGTGAGTTTFNGVSGSQLFGGTSNSYIQVQEIMG